MISRRSFMTLVSAAAAALLLGACGAGAAPATLADIPAYPGATDIKGNVADTLAKNMQQDAALRQAMAAGGKIEQKGYQLPKDAKWDAVKAFYAEKLKGSGWGEGLGNVGGIAGGLVNNVMKDVMTQVNTGNDLFQTTFFSKDKQTLSVIMITSPTNKDDKQLILSLNTN